MVLSTLVTFRLLQKPTRTKRYLPACTEVCYIHQVWTGAGLQCPTEAAHDSQTISTGKAGTEDDLILLLQ